MSVSLENKSVNVQNNIALRKSFPEKPLVNSTNFMVSTPHQLASEAGKKILEKGGSAADAAIFCYRRRWRTIQIKAIGIKCTCYITGFGRGVRAWCG